MACTRALVFSSLLALVAALAVADDWGPLANISTTMGVNGGRLCAGEATRGDLGCPTYAPSLTTAGDVSVTGNLSATKFIGDGSSLTGISAGLTATDRISSSGVASGAGLGGVMASYGTVSFTTGGTAGTSYIDTTGRYIGPGISTTSFYGVSSTYGYFSDHVSIGAASAAAQLDVRTATGGNSLVVSDNNYSSLWFTHPSNKRVTFVTGSSAQGVEFQLGSASFIPLTLVSGTAGGRGWVGVGTTTPSVTLHISSAGAEAARFQSDNDPYITLYKGGTRRGYWYSDGSNNMWLSNDQTAATIFTVANTEKMRVASNGNVGIRTTTPVQTFDVSGTASIASNTAIGMNATPSATLDVSGSFKISGNDGTNCSGGNDIGRIRRNSTTGKFEICRW